MLAWWRCTIPTPMTTWPLPLFSTQSTSTLECMCTVFWYYVCVVTPSDINDNVTTKTQNTFNTAHMNTGTWVRSSLVSWSSSWFTLHCMAQGCCACHLIHTWSVRFSFDFESSIPFFFLIFLFIFYLLHFLPHFFHFLEGRSEPVHSAKKGMDSLDESYSLTSHAHVEWLSPTSPSTSLSFSSSSPSSSSFFIFLHFLLPFTFLFLDVADYNHAHCRWGAGFPGQQELLHRLWAQRPLHHRGLCRVHPGVHTEHTHTWVYVHSLVLLVSAHRHIAHAPWLKSWVLCSLVTHEVSDSLSTLISPFTSRTSCRTLSTSSPTWRFVDNLRIPPKESMDSFDETYLHTRRRAPFVHTWIQQHGYRRPRSHQEEFVERSHRKETSGKEVQEEDVL